MNVQAPPSRPGYGILVEQLNKPIYVRHKGQLIAQSSRAKVMYETRLPPAIYIPTADLIAPLSAPTALKTFCPFKGTATYRDLQSPAGTVPNIAWQYDCAFSEAHEICNHICFGPHEDLEVDPGDNDLANPTYRNISGPLIDWLLRDAAYIATPDAFTEALVEKFIEQGIALSRMSVLVWSLHPMIAGRNFIWTKGESELQVRAPSYEIYDEPKYRDSPMRHVSKGLGGVRHRLTKGNEIGAFPILEDLQRAGATDYVAMPLPFSDGRINVMTVASDHPDGFTTENLGLIFECSAVIARYYEVFMQRENAKSLLETYVGKRSGARVLGGEIRRGDGDEIDAAIMFCDLRGSTLLEETLGRRAYISLLNTFFEGVSDIIEDNGGEVLKFIGDAVLAVFPAGADADRAREQALRSARFIVQALGPMGAECETPDLDCAIGIAFGSVTYGNIGSRERLDFTVIGQAANIAARLGDYGKTIGEQIVVDDKSLCQTCTATPLGALALHNVSTPVTSYAIPVTETISAPVPGATVQKGSAV